jgi:threonine/homoserine/homoserine lactone efflux protein
LVLGLVFVAIGCVTDSAYALTASSLRTVLLRGRALPFVQRWVAGSVFILLGVLAGTASAGSNK